MTGHDVTDGVDLPQPTADSTRDELGVVGIGALNLDYIASSASMSRGVGTRSLTSRLERLGATGSFEPGTEKSVDEATIHAVLAEMSTISLEATLGGSAYNVIYTLTQMKLGLSLGFVGVAGRVPTVSSFSTVSQFDRLGVDRRFVRVDDTQTCGICFSFANGSDRTLLTHIGANAKVAKFIDEEFEALVGYLRAARVIHVTSFLDADTPDRLLTLLTAVRRGNERVIISFDPGYEWSVSRAPAVDSIARISDVLLLNTREFRAFGRYSPGDDDLAIAAKLLGRLDNSRSMMIVKRDDGVLSFRANGDAVVTDHLPHKPLADPDIEDSTGAGDVFAAGLLAVLASRRLQTDLGCLLGMRLAKHKMRHVGVHGHGDLPEVTKSFLRSRGGE